MVTSSSPDQVYVLPGVTVDVVVVDCKIRPFVNPVAEKLTGAEVSDVM